MTITDAITLGSIVSQPGTQGAEHTLLMAFQRAYQRAVQLKRAIIVSVQVPLDQVDVLHIFAHLQQNGSDNAFFWQQPTKDVACAGCGCAYSLARYGAAPVRELAHTLQTLLADALIVPFPFDDSQQKGAFAPLFYGGFAFDAVYPRTALWNGFPDGLLILPDVLVCQDKRGALGVVNTMIKPTDTALDHLQKVLSALAYLETITTCTRSPEMCPASSQESMSEQEMEGQTSGLDMHELVSQADWLNIVAWAVEQIDSRALQKVVLARAVNVKRRGHQARPLALDVILRHLSQNEADACIFAIQRGEQVFLGASPERLVHAQDRQVRTMALAGTASRGSSTEEDRALGEMLLGSKKNQNEHAIVSDMVRATLETLCSEVAIADNPHLLKLNRVQHLITPVTGKLLPDYSILDVVAHLHPTPAVGGLPLQSALQVIREREQLDRGWYAGPLGWLDAHGNGEFIVALRSCLLRGNEATLFAGCGIVADSDPQSEYQESCLKLAVMLRGLAPDPA